MCFRRQSFLRPEIKPSQKLSLGASRLSHIEKGATVIPNTRQKPKLESKSSLKKLQRNVMNLFVTNVFQKKKK